ncbi:hypothetical protein [Streptomyces sp. NBC_01565]|uniref:hypothetical protein n=1 Tax=Streptomyces sp. NBC_01565 TaxID=2975881 RepID=UPI00224FAB65|nr:hypothetical protein [Streptomyces sp. NBC_01565]MCX4547234.1 hypothetical protein [Streptomyces sp. NBC_01565]
MSTGAQVREIVRPGSAFTALWSGSVVLGGMVCRCAGRVVGWVWDVASVDAEATEAVQAKADKAAKAKAAKAKAKARKAAKADQDDDDLDDDQEPEDDAEVTAPAVKPVRRPAGEALGLAAFGGLLVSGAAGTAGTLLWPYVQLLGPWRGVLAGAGVLGWMVAAWMLAPPPAPQDDHENDREGEEHEDDVQEQPQDAEDAEPAPDRGTALLLHVLTALSDAEYTRRAGVHLDVVLASAVARGLLAEGTEQSVFRGWVEATGLPTVDKLGMRIEGTPTTRVGLRVDAVTAALGMTPTALLNARSQAPVQARGEARAGAVVVPVQAVGETPVEAAAGTPAEAPAPAPVSTPAPAVLRLIPGGLLDPDSAPSPALSQGQVQEAR